VLVEIILRTGLLDPSPTLFDHKDNRKIKNGETTKDKEPINELEKVNK
jgi:hypothetical protein